ncbi:MAG: pseudouridine synthase [Tepidisphaeraceae bacterium]
MKERIQKLLADAGVESRRHVEEMVLQGRIQVNGELVWTLPVMVDPEVDQISIDGERVFLPKKEAQERVYIILNKPRGVYCTNVAQGEQKRAIDLLPPEIDHRVYPVGRLDADSRGLLLLTNDGDLTQQLTHPKFGVAKTYTALVDGFVKPETIQRLAEGIWLADPEKGGFKTGRTYIKMIKRTGQSSVLQITIREGRNRQVRRMLAKVGHKVRELTRIKIGPLELGRLKPGDFRLLNAWEVDKLREQIKPKERPGQAEGRSSGGKRDVKPGARPSGKGGKRPAGDASRPRATGGKPGFAKRPGGSGGPARGKPRATGGARGNAKRGRG